MAIAKTKYPTDYLRQRRKALGLSQGVVAKALGITRRALVIIEKRGALPETHFEKLAEILKVSVLDLKVEKYAPMMQEVFGIPHRCFRDWIKSHEGFDRSSLNLVREWSRSGDPFEKRKMFTSIPS